MSEETDQEKTEEATPRRQQQAREKGQVVRSRDFSIMSVLTLSAIYFLCFGSDFYKKISDLMGLGLTIPRELIFDPSSFLNYANDFLFKAFNVCLPFFIFVFIVTIFSNLMVGGWNFSVESLGFNFSRLNPIQGLARIFSMKSVVELVKSILKFVLIACFLMMLFYNNKEKIIFLSGFDPFVAISKGGGFILKSYLILTIALVVIVLIDVPWQFWDHAKKLRMTFQEIKDEYKQTEGKPEVKRKIREMQRAISRRKMLQEIPTADVVITNPTHYAVAIRYRQGEDAAPIVVGKGQELIAEQIRKIAYLNKIPVVSSPPLARALYHHTPLDQPIPRGLYIAVAQILAYVYALKRYKSGLGERPKDLKDLDIPSELRREH